MVVNATALRAYAIILEVKRYGTRTACPWSVWNRPAIELAARTTRSLMVASRSHSTARRATRKGRLHCDDGLLPDDPLTDEALVHI